MTADSLFETTSIPGHLAPTPERLERLLSKQTLEELYEVEEQPFARCEKTPLHAITTYVEAHARYCLGYIV
ncbi:hypothetical protein EAG_00874 [Camponotus floridanus]|uniref:Uncharacterized protein n=1 Tax=Camponotus floridanus TaxID=104421 RepID=E1ZW94_CAMFO|nr:hypothetical protein EAG_00874 [Camponotus floridanus]